ncbi:MAG TPA: endonuclease/exonuclease/phosphatase family protein [Gaiella sp.]|uniref:endonuclease/exonuclease/phosphatase family protein n=1 Tax=Gaiella sp. TaxID=2663207 RepID=UPI002D7ED77D|nr:endonuclease/exonuclease/phosphatase family protein [Gaiella sp.]HET9287689.1 endonuclease/exonuclease/phosphatase family protein [Gaiella sp.]
MAALRLMTFNVQLLPFIAGVLDGTVSVPTAVVGLFPGGNQDAVARAEAVAKDILSIRPGERPDVIGLNEVFSEDGRSVLLDALQPVWPNVIEIVFEGDVEEDAGLMVFSRLPFQQLPNGSDRAERFYSDDAGDDSWASKAAVLVQVSQPVENMTLVFTHLQAAYVTEEEHREIRKRQLAEVRELVAEVLGPDIGVWANVVVAGDLNIRGDAGMSSDEWFEIFDTPGDPFGELFADSWIEMRPPNETVDHDPGHTNRNRETQQEQRLDYLCRLKTPDGIDVVAHHMRVGHRDVSDHYALEGLFQLRDAHCQPSSASDIDAQGPIVGAPDPSRPRTSAVYHTNIEITRLSGRHWLWIPRPGTYTFHAPPTMEYEVFADTDISTPLERLDSLSVVELPPSLQWPYDRFGRVDPVGGTYVNRSPLLVAVRSRNGGPVQGPFLVFEHLGDSPRTAIALPPHLDVEVPFPANQLLGADDTAWFRVMPRPTLMAKPRDERVTVRYPGGASGSLEALDAGMSSLGGTSGGGELEHSFVAVGDDNFLVAVTRDSDQDVGHVIRWETPVSYLRLDKGFTVHVNDETGPDWPGADEPELEVRMDSDAVPLLKTAWDDADTGEDWPGLVEKLWFEALQRGWTPPRPVKEIAFAESIDVVIEDPDSPLGAAHGVVSHTINPLSPNEPAEKKRTMAINVFDTISDGTYTLSCTLSRDP